MEEETSFLHNHAISYISKVHHFQPTSLCVCVVSLQQNHMNSEPD